MVWSVSTMLSLNFIIYFIFAPVFKNPKTDMLMTWQPYFVLNGISISVVLLAMGLPADLLLLGLSAAFCTLRIITCEELLGGLSNEGVVAVAALCAVSAAIDKTKALNNLMGKALGTPTNPAVAMFRMAVPLITLGSVFNNTPLVAVFIPIVKDWTVRAGLDVGQFMMPLSFFAMLSATLTTMGSSTNLLAVKLVPEANIKFLDPAPVGLLIIVTGVTYCVLLGPCMLPRTGATAEASSSKGDGLQARRADIESPLSEPPVRDKYTVHFKVASHGPLVGQTAQNSGLLNALSEPAIVRCTVGNGSKELEPGDRLALESATAEDIMAMAAIPGLRLQAFSAWYRAAAAPEKTRKNLFTKSVKKVQSALKLGVAKIPNYPSGLGIAFDQAFESGIEAGARLGVGPSMPVRRWVAAGMGGGWADAKNCLCKLVVPPGGPHGLRSKLEASPSSGSSADSGPLTVGLADIVGHLQDLHCTLLGMCGTLPDQDMVVSLKGGEVFLVESLAAKVSDEMRRAYALVSIVEEQPVPRNVRLSPLDPLRPLLAVMGLLVTVVFAAMDVAPLDAVAILVALSSLLLGTLEGKDLYRSINGPVLLTVAASFGAGAAIYNTGLATCLASGVLFVAEPMGHSAIMGALVGLALTLGVFVSNNTVVILLAPLIKDICIRRNLSLKMAMLAVIYAANLSFATPFSYQTNMMVMPHGHYVFIDYVKFGVPMMLICGVVALLGTFAYWGG